MTRRRRHEGSVARSWSALVALAAIALALAACVTNGGDPDPAPPTGNLAVVVSGLPSGSNADVEVAGVGITQTLAASATLAGLSRWVGQRAGRDRLRLEQPVPTDYRLSINAYCFQACDYTPYEE